AGLGLPAAGQAFDRGDLLALDVEGEDETRREGAAVDEDGASAAVSAVAREIGPGEAEVVAHELQERAVAGDLTADHASVDLEDERMAVLHPPGSGGHGLAGGDRLEPPANEDPDHLADRKSVV